MKKYRVAITVQILIILCSLFILVAGPIILLNLKLTLFEQIVIIFGMIFFSLGLIAMYHLKINTDERKIEMFMLEILAILLGKTSGITRQILYWDEIEELRGIRTLFAESPIIRLTPKASANKKPMEFMGFPLELIKDILSHLPPDAKVNLYPYLKRKLEGKQTIFYTK